jgi:hypothetical protein
VDTQSPQPVHVPDLAPDLAPAEASLQASARPVLADLIAAGLVSHEMIGDPALIGSEAEALRALCAGIGGPVWRLDPFHYAFRARPEDLGGRLAGTDPAGWAAAIAAALRAALGPDLAAEAVWISAADLGAAAEPLPEAPVLLLRAQDAAVEEGLAAAGPGTQAVISARFAVEAARLASHRLAGLLAGDEPGSALARRLLAIETRQEEMLELLGERAGETASLAALGRLGGTLQAALQAVAERLDAQAAALAALAAETGALAARDPEARQEQAREAGAFRQGLGLTLAEFLARMEQAAESRAPDLAPHAPALADRLLG